MNKSTVESTNLILNYADEKKTISKDEAKNQSLVKRIKQGDKNAVEQLCSLNEKYILNILTLMSNNNRALAEDLTQDVLIKMVTSINQYSKSDYQFRSWLSSIIKSTFIDHKRREKARAEFSTNLVDFSQVYNREDSNDNGGVAQNVEYEFASVKSVEDVFIKNEKSAEIKRIVDKSINSLSNVNQKRAISLNVFEDYSYNEISEKLGMSLSNTKVLLNRAKLGILKNIVEQNYHLAGTILNQHVVMESVVGGASIEDIAEGYEISQEEVGNIISSSLDNIYKLTFFTENIAESIA